MENYKEKIEKINNMKEYSSQFAPRHTKDELIDIISKSELVEK